MSAANSLSGLLRLELPDIDALDLGPAERHEEQETTAIGQKHRPTMTAFSFPSCVAGVAGPPVAFTRRNPVSPNVNKMSPSRFHAPPRATPESASARGRPP